jgi:hypothetical protein
MGEVKVKATGISVYKGRKDARHRQLMQALK